MLFSQIINMSIGFGEGGKVNLSDIILIKNVFKLEYQEHFVAVVSKLFDHGILVALGNNGVYSIVYESECL